MSGRSIARGVLVSLATLGLCLPQPLWAGSSAPTTVATDIALQKGGLLVGQVVDPLGKPIAGAQVTLTAQGKRLAEMKSTPEGYFAFKGLRGGVYQVVTQEGHGVYRAWSPGTAPPAAKTAVVLVSGDDVVRGQEDTPPWKVLLANPLVIGAVVATAVAVPVAIHNSNHHRPSSP